MGWLNLSFSRLQNNEKGLQSASRDFNNNLKRLIYTKQAISTRLLTATSTKLWLNRKKSSIKVPTIIPFANEDMRRENLPLHLLTWCNIGCIQFDMDERPVGPGKLTGQSNNAIYRKTSKDYFRSFENEHTWSDSMIRLLHLLLCL